MNSLNKDNVMSMANMFTEKVLDKTAGASAKISKWIVPIFILMLVAVGSLVYTLISLNSDGSQCLQDPFTYGAMTYAEQINGHVNCQCTATALDGRSGSISFDEDGLIEDKDYFDTIEFGGIEE